MKPKSEAKLKWENFWYYYKLHVVAGAFIIIVISSFIYNKVTAQEYDYSIAILSTKSLTFEDEETLVAAFQSCGQDLNNDGDVKVKILHYNLDNSDNADPNQLMASQTQMIGDLQLGTSMIYIYSDKIYNDFKGKGIFPEDDAKRFLLSNSSQNIPDALAGFHISMVNLERVDDKDNTQKYFNDSQDLLDQFLKYSD